MRLLLLALLTLLAAAAPAAAQTQADLTRQAGSDFARADAAMNVQYRATMASMRRMDALSVAPTRTRRTGPSYANALLQAQHAWLGFRDAQCTAEGYEFLGGSAQGMAIGQCRARLTRERSAQLRAMSWQR